MRRLVLAFTAFSTLFCLAATLTVSIWYSTLSSTFLLFGMFLYFGTSLYFLQRLYKQASYQENKYQALFNRRSRSLRVAHDFWLEQMAFFRRPLNGLVAVKDLYANNEGTNALDYFDIVAHSSRIIRRRIEKLQLYSELVSTNFQHDVEAISLKKVIGQSIRTTRELYPNRKTTFEEEWAEGLPEYVYGHQILLENLFTEAFELAIQSGAGDLLKIKIYPDNLQPNQLVFQFSFGGQPVVDALRANLSQHRKHNAASGNWPKTTEGLSASLIQNIIGALDGNINPSRLEKDKNHLYITFSLAPAVRKPVENVKQSHRQNSSRILIVEDDATCEFILSRLLKRAGLSRVQVDTSTDGQDAVVKCQKNKYDLIFMDLNIPLINGFDATSIIINDTQNINAKIIATSSHSREEDKRRFLDCGGIDFIEKPITYDRLYEKLMDLGIVVAKTPPGPDEKFDDLHTASQQKTILIGNYLIDFESLNSELDGDTSLCLEVLSVASNSLSDLAVQIEHNLLKGAYDRLRAPVHKMKGELLSIKCTQGAQLALQLEAALDSNEKEDIESAAQALLSLCGALFREMDGIHDRSAVRNSAA